MSMKNAMTLKFLLPTIKVEEEELGRALRKGGLQAINILMSFHGDEECVVADGKYP